MTPRQGRRTTGLDQGAAIVADGRRLHLGRRLNSGGAGSIHLVEGAPDQVAKIYHPGSDHAAYHAKLEAMLRLRPHLPDRQENGKRYVQIAWPEAIVHDSSGNFTGFLMPMLDIDATRDLEHILNERQARAAGLPTSLGAKATLAANLASVLSALHRKGHRVVDLKPVNLRFYIHSLYIAMLDCDGFSIQGRDTRFRAPQVTADYLAPEYQQRGIGSGDEEAQDRFALAVIVFQLLNSGIHPYSGQLRRPMAPTDLPGRIRTGHYPYGVRPHPHVRPVPASAHAAMPPQLRELFDRAFAGPPAERPSAAEWAQLLAGYAQRNSGLLATCAQDNSHQHFQGMPCAACQRSDILSRARTSSNQARKRRQAKRARHALKPSPRHGHPIPQPLPQPVPPPAPLGPVAKVGWGIAAAVLALLTLVPIIDAVIPELPTSPSALTPALAPAEPDHAPGGLAWGRRMGLDGHQARIDQAWADTTRILDAVIAQDHESFAIGLQRMALYARVQLAMTQEASRWPNRINPPMSQVATLVRKPGRSIDRGNPLSLPAIRHSVRRYPASSAESQQFLMERLQSSPHDPDGWSQLHFLMLDHGEDGYAAAAYAVALTLSSAPGPFVTGDATDDQAPDQNRESTARRHGHHLAGALGYRNDVERHLMQDTAP
ncbi:hypothetical protein WCE55_11005 [Luteimonas sp. MJ293]|uniref:hypothetical protein n=1 Tax=Luteimonas sp. MJ146 TaxID=3129240 RepID=UPI0031BA29DE